MPGTTHESRAVREAAYSLAETLWERLAVVRVDTRVDRYASAGVAAHLGQPPTRAEALDLVAGLGGVAIREVEFRAGGSSAWVDIALTWRGQTLVLTVFHSGDDRVGGGH
jgi:hypothetical protein